MVWGISADTSDEEYWGIQARNKRIQKEREERERWKENTKEKLKKEILEEMKNEKDGQ